MDALIRERGWESYGRARINLYLNEGLDPVSSRSLIDHFLSTSKHSFAPSARVENNYNMRNFEYEKSLRLVVILSTLGISMFMLLMMIQYNIGISKIENEREQLGTLRALGVTKLQYRWAQRTTGLVLSLTAIVAANLLFFTAYTVYGLRWQIGVWNGLMTSLHHFPWLLFGWSQLVFLIVSMAIFYTPLRGVLKLQPIENINALQR